MKLINLSILITLGILLPLIGISQYGPHQGTTQSSRYHDISRIPMARWKFYGGIGSSVYGGEVTGRKIFSDNSALKAERVKPSFTLGAGYKFHNRFFLKAEFTSYTIKAVENNQTMKNFRRIDNFQFRATNFDFSVVGQLNLLPYTYFLRKEINIVPYVVVGLGITSSTPQGLNNGHWENLQSLSNNQIKNKVLGTVPFGVGVLYRLNSQLDIGLDATVRYTLGGSLDGDSRKGISTASLSKDEKAYFDQYYSAETTGLLKDHKKYNDLYSLVQVRLQYTFIPEKFKHLFRQKNINISYCPKKSLR